MVKKNNNVRIEKDSTTKDWVTFVAKTITDGKVVGKIAFSHNGKGEWTVLTLKVEEPFLRKGIGSMLLNKAKTEVRKSGGKMIRLCATENTDRFYEKRGMRQSDFGGEFTTHFWVPKPKPRQNPRGTTKKLPLGIAPQNLLRKPTIILRKRR